MRSPTTSSFRTRTIDWQGEPMWWMTLSTGSEVDERAETFQLTMLPNWPRRLNWYAGAADARRGVSARWADGVVCRKVDLIRKEVRFVDRESESWS